MITTIGNFPVPDYGVLKKCPWCPRENVKINRRGQITCGAEFCKQKQNAMTKRKRRRS